MSDQDRFPPDALDELVARHPRLLPKAPNASGLPAGWLVLADRLFADLEQLLGDRAERFEALQIKEKFAELRVYYRLRGGKRPPLHADLFGVRTRTDQQQGDTRVSPTAGGVHLTIVPDSELDRVLLDRVEAATAESRRTCQVCGAPGETVRAGGWYTTRCPVHAPKGAKRVADDQ